MNGSPTPERLAALAAFSRQLNAAGAPSALPGPITIDEKGYAFGVCPEDEDGSIGVFLHAGVRLGWAPGSARRRADLFVEWPRP